MRCLRWVNSVDLGLSDECPPFPRKRRKSGHTESFGSGHIRTHAEQHSVGSSDVNERASPSTGGAAVFHFFAVPP